MKVHRMFFRMLCISVWCAIASSGLAQTLTPADPPFDWLGLGGWFAGAMIVVLIVVLFKHNPISVASLRESLANLTHSHANLVDKHAALVETHAEVLKMAAPKPADQQPIIRRLV